MADEKVKAKAPAKAAKPSWIKRVGLFFKSLPKRIATPFKNMWHELRKVTWPTKKDLINYSLIVIGFMLIMGVIIGLLDMGASKLIQLLIAA